MNILMCVDNKFVKGLIVSLYSLLANTHEHINLYISGVPHDKITKNKAIKKYIKANQLDIFIVSNLFTKHENVVANYVRKRFPLVSTHRVLAPFLLDVDRLLYLDSDLLILNDLSSFYNDYFEEAIVAIEDFESSKKDHDIILGNYFNSGVALFNCRKIQKNYKLDDISKILEIYSKRIYYPDQDILNFLFNSDKKNINNNFNFQVRDYYQIEEKDILQKNIIHFVGMPKPWMFKFKNSYLLALYWEYCSKCFGKIPLIILKFKRAVYYFLIKLNHLRKGMFNSKKNEKHK